MQKSCNISGRTFIKGNDSMNNKRKEFEWPPKIKITYKIEPQKIEFIEYELNTYFYWNEPAVHTEIYRVERKGRLLKKEIFRERQTWQEEVKQIEKEIESSKVIVFFQDIADFLAPGTMILELFADDSEGVVKFHFSDGHVEEYDRGLAHESLSLKYLSRLVESFVDDQELIDWKEDIKPTYE